MSVQSNSFSVGKKCVYLEYNEGFFWGQLTKKKFYHKRDLVMKSFWPVFVIELNDTGMRLCHKVCALLLE
jgi:hypothetical protein